MQGPLGQDKGGPIGNRVVAQLGTGNGHVVLCRLPRPLYN